jgi:drug/metabolite transporter (DMT)-like permease
MQNAIYYLVPVLIWGSTWFAITFQLGIVPPQLSVAYRFLLAAGLLFAYIFARKLPIAFSRRDHAYMALQGLLLFSFNYFLVYLSEFYISSGMAAILFSTLIVMNVLFGRLFLGTPIQPRVLAGAFVGLVGIAFIFAPEVASFNLRGGAGLGLLLAMLSAATASLGNIASARNQKHNIPVIQANAFGMAYGSGLMFIVSWISGVDLSFDPSPSYVLSLFYLALFGSVIAFGAYLTLLGRIGAGRAAYTMILFPVVALVLSTIFEGMTWSGPQFGGVALVLAGNGLVALRRSASASKD